MPTYEITALTTFECDFTIEADSREEAIAEAEELASDSRLIYLKCMHCETTITNISPDEDEEELCDSEEEQSEEEPSEESEEETE